MTTAEMVHSAPNTLTDMTIPLARIRPSTFNPRKRFDADSLQELADSIREHGLLEPIVVRPIAGALLIKGDTYLYEIVAGERRYRACKIAGLQEIPARVADGLSDTAALKLAIIENVQRVDLDPLEEAEGYRQLARLGMRQREIAESVNRSQPAVANAMRLLELPESVQAKIRAGELSASHGIALASYRVNRHVQEGLAEIAVKQDLPTKKLERYFASLHFVPDELKTCVYSFGYDTKFDWKSECRGACPHDAFRAVSSSLYGGYCLRPACYEGKQRAMKVAEQERIQAIVEQKTQGGGELPRLGDIPWESRTEFRYGKSPFAQCLASCPSFTVALDGSTKVQICTKPSCFRKLDKAQEREKNAARRETGQGILEQVIERVDRLGGLGTKEAALIALAALGHLDAASARAAIERNCPEMGRVDPTNWQWRSKSFQAIEPRSHEIIGLLKAVVEASLRYEIRQRYELGYGDPTRFTNWYLGIQEEVQASAPPADEPADDGLGSTILICRECGRTDEDEDYEGDWEEDTLCGACAQESGEADGDG